MKGWILDVVPDLDRDLMDVWIISEEGERLRLSDPYRPSIHVSGDRDMLAALGDHLGSMEAVRRVVPGEAVLDVHHLHPSPCLRVEIPSYTSLTPVAREIERIGRYKAFSLYDVDTRLSTRYMLRRGIRPLAHVEVGREFRVLDDPDWGREPLPPMKALAMHLAPDKAGPMPLLRDPIREVRLGDWSDSGRSESELIISLVREIRERDPDILITAGGDSFVMPYLYHRSIMSGTEGELYLDRSGDLFRAPMRDGKSYFSYGNIMYKPHSYTLKGRLHLDAQNSFVSHEGGIIGLSALSRMSLLPLQEMARLSPGSAISYMECVEALNRGRHVRWKKNIPEEWKTAVELSLSDRGGHVFDPLVGLHSDVVEMDFSSFYPHIMWKRNISVETLNCGCCAEDGFRVPRLDHHICRRHEGLIARVVGEILSTRMRAKELSRSAPEAEFRFPEEAGLGDLVPETVSARYGSISNILKWVLVTCFGYTGYRNARFGKIEAHESITAYAREYILRAKEAVEDLGFTLLHGIVDSMWVQGPTRLAEEAARSARDATGIPIEVETVYRWIVFLPNRTNGAGALTKYYGLRGDGVLKMRGIETRQHSTPPFIKKVQEEAISALAGASCAEELPLMLDEVLSVLGRRGRELMDGRIDPRDLAVTIRVSRDLDDYSTNSEQVAALRLMRDAGVEVPPGQKVRFVILDHSARRAEDRVALLTDGMTSSYDTDRYLALTARAVGNALGLLGLDGTRALEALKGVEQKGLADFAS